MKIEPYLVKLVDDLKLKYFDVNRVLALEIKDEFRILIDNKKLNRLGIQSVVFNYKSNPDFVLIEVNSNYLKKKSKEVLDKMVLNNNIYISLVRIEENCKNIFMINGLIIENDLKIYDINIYYDYLNVNELTVHLFYYDNCNVFYICPLSVNAIENLLLFNWEYKNNLLFVDKCSINMDDNNSYMTIVEIGTLIENIESRDTRLIRLGEISSVLNLEDDLIDIDYLMLFFEKIVEHINSKYLNLLTFMVYINRNNFDMDELDEISYYYNSKYKIKIDFV